MGFECQDGGLCEEGKPLGECLSGLLPRFVTGVVISGLEWRHGITTLLELSQGSATDAFWSSNPFFR